MRSIPKPVCVCPWCEKEFIPKSFKYMKFCSANCGRYFVMSIINANRKHKCKFCSEWFKPKIKGSHFCNDDCEIKFKKQRELNIQRANEHNEIQHLWAIERQKIERLKFLNKMCKRCKKYKRVRKGIVYCDGCYKILKKERCTKAKEKQRNDRRQLVILKTALEDLNLLPPRQRLKYANRREKENAKREYLLTVKQAAIQIGLI